MLSTIKDYLLLILLIAVGVLSMVLLGRKPEWVRQKEKTIKKRRGLINESEKETERRKQKTEDLTREHDETISELQENINNLAKRISEREDEIKKAKTKLEEYSNVVKKNKLKEDANVEAEKTYSTADNAKLLDNIISGNKGGGPS